GPGMDFLDVTDGAVPDQLASLADEIAGVTLIAHRGGNAGFLRDTRDLPRHPDVVRERLLAIDMLFEAHRADAHVGMQVIGRGAKNCIDGLLLLQQVTKILVSRDFVIWRLRGEVLLDLGLHRPTSGASLVIERVEILW